MIKIKRSQKKRFAWYYDKDIRMLLIGLYWFVVGIDLRFQWFRGSWWYKHFHKNCLVCKKPLFVNSIYQIVNYHRRCRKYRHHPERYVQKLA